MLMGYSDDFTKTGGSGRFWYKDNSAAGDSQCFNAEAMADTPPIISVSENLEYNAGFAACGLSL